MNDAPTLAPGTPAAEAARRRTFAIISHPDAGKTTLTEKLLAATDRLEQTRLGAELDLVRAELEVAEERWLTLLD